MKENDRENVASTSTVEDEITVRDTKSDNDSISKTVNDTKDEEIQLLAPETASLEPIEVASGRLVSDKFYSCVYECLTNCTSVLHRYSFTCVSIYVSMYIFIPG